MARLANRDPGARAQPAARSQDFKRYRSIETMMRIVSAITVEFLRGLPAIVGGEALDETQRLVEQWALAGHVVVRTGNPVRRQDGRWELAQEIVEAEAQGYSSLVGGRVLVSQHAEKRSLGRSLQAEPGLDFPADSTFALYLLLTFPDCPILPALTNEPAIVAHCQDMQSIPPLRHAFSLGGPAQRVALLDPEGAQRGWILESDKIPYSVVFQRPTRRPSR